MAHHPSHQQLLDDAIEAAVHAACLSIQTALGVKTGDTAGQHFPHPLVIDNFPTQLSSYISAELEDISIAEHELNVRDEVKSALVNVTSDLDLDEAADRVIEVMRKREML